MKKIEAILRPYKLDDVRRALTNLGVKGLTVTDVRGQGGQVGYTEIYRGIEYQVDLLSKVKLEIVVEDDRVDACLDLLMEAGRTGKIGDGKVFVSPIERVLRIRTGEEDKQAV